MIPGFEKLVEERIREGQRQGLFDDLDGRGRPLELDDNRNVPEDLRIAYKMLKNGDCLPPEIELRRDIQGKRRRDPDADQGLPRERAACPCRHGFD